jgi:hypothetical protein
MLKLGLGRGNRLADAVHALLIQPGTARRGHAADPADARQGTARAPATGTFLASGAACIAREAGALGRAAGVSRAADLAFWAADALPNAELPARTALAGTGCAHRPTLAGAVDLAAAGIVDDLIAFPPAELAARFRMASSVVSLSVIPATVMIAIMVPAATADDCLIATATGSLRDHERRVRDAKVKGGGKRGAQTA